MHTFIIRDVRLNGWRPAGNDVLEVNFDTPIQWVFDCINNRSATYGGDLRVKFMCHGLPGYLQFANGGFTHPELSPGNGINASVLSKFTAITGKLKKLELHSCLVARMGSCFETTSLGFTTVYDGNSFCFKLAQIIQAEVQASIHVQYYWGNDGSNALRFSGWNGRVFTWNPSGSIKQMQDFPYTAYVDADPNP